VFETLVIQTAFLGDLLLGIPLFKKIRQLHPDGRITVLCRRGLGSFLLDAGIVDEVIEVDKGSASDRREAKTKLSVRAYDLILTPHESLRSGLITLGLEGKKKIGFRSWFNRFFFDVRIERPIGLPEALRQLSLLKTESEAIVQQIHAFETRQARSGGRKSDSSLLEVPSELDMVLPALKSLRAARSQNLDWKSRVSREVEGILSEADGKRVAVLAPGSVWATKMWTKSGFIAVGNRLVEMGYLVLVMGSAQEAELCAAIASSIPGAQNVAGRSNLYGSAQLLALSELLVCNDSGAMHLGACSGIPTVSVFGPTVLDFGYRPWNKEAEVVELELGCRPCGAHGSKACPLGTHACMKDLSPALVISSIEKLLSGH
jgi:heptosyltransferase-2